MHGLLACAALSVAWVDAGTASWPEFEGRCRGYPKSDLFTVDAAAHALPAQKAESCGDAAHRCASG